jgi:hypothetical protein
MRVAAVLTASVALFAAAGCSTSANPSTVRDDRAAELADTLREEALKLPADGSRERLVSGLLTLRDLMRPEGSARTGPTSAVGAGSARSATSSASAATPGVPVLPGLEDGGSAPAWALMFAPKSLVIGFFTESKDFSGAGTPEGIEVRVQPIDQFGDPTKAIGSYRIEVFEYHPRSGEKRGPRLGHWFVPVLDVESNRKYYVSVDRSYVFPLLWEKPIAKGTSVIVQATYYPPAGFQEKLFAQRVIKIGAEGE